MIDVSVSIIAILMCCDDSVAGINIGRGYSINKVYFDSFPLKSRITDGRDQLNTDYYTSRLRDQNGTYFMCIEKSDNFQISGPVFDGRMRAYTNDDFACQNELQPHMDREIEYLNNRINLLRVFHEGNIGFRNIFFPYKYTVFGMPFSSSMDSYFGTRNIVDSRRYSLADCGVQNCNSFISAFEGRPYELMKSCIDEFSWGLEQMDPATGFEQYTTTLEMTLLATNQAGKKQALANRVAAILGGNSSEIQTLHQKMLDFYRFRSESLHEGNGSNITSAELRELEGIVRDILKWCLGRCKADLSANPAITWTEVKNSIISDVVTQVLSLKTQGILPN